MSEFAFAFDRLRKAASSLPEVEEGTSYGTPALKVRNKMICRIKDADTVVLRCTMQDKDMLMAAVPEIYFETPHYEGWPAVLVRIRSISDEELAHRLAIAWRMQAPKKLAARAESARGQ